MPFQRASAALLLGLMAISAACWLMFSPINSPIAQTDLVEQVATNPPTTNHRGSGRRDS